MNETGYYFVVFAMSRILFVLDFNNVCVSPIINNPFGVLTDTKYEWRIYLCYPFDSFRAAAVTGWRRGSAELSIIKTIKFQFHLDLDLIPTRSALICFDLINQIRCLI
jgi:hypothetical protein